MPNALKLGFGPFTVPAKGVFVVFCDEGLKFGPATRRALGGVTDIVARAARSERFTGKKSSTLDLVMPAGLKAARLVVIGVGKVAELTPKDFLRLGGPCDRQAAEFDRRRQYLRRTAGRRDASGAGGGSGARDPPARVRIRSQQTKRKEDEKPPAVRNITIAVGDVAAVRKADIPRVAISDGVVLARTLVNEPANVLYPEESARRAGALKKLRVAVEVLDVKAMKKLGMSRSSRGRWSGLAV